MNKPNDLCPCCSGSDYEKCCQPFHDGKFPENALQLMRSRYSAYALNLPDYLMETSHPNNLQYSEDPVSRKNTIIQFARESTFHNLKILDFKEKGSSATVTFTAYISQGSQDITFTERSEFEKVNNRWLYLKGQLSKGYDPELIIPAPLVSGVYAASLTPMHPDLTCNYEALANHCKDLMARGCKGVVLFGTTGEGASFSVQERTETIKKVIELGVDPKKIMMGVSCSSIIDAVRLASVSVEFGCAAALILPPFFYKKIDESGIIAFYREIIQRVGRPELKILLYHIPQYSGVSITLSIIKQLREEFPNNIVGIKESEGNISLTKEVLSTFPGFQVFVGNELQISEAAKLGASGAITGVVNDYPELICSLYEYGINAQLPNHNEKAKEIINLIRQYPTLPAMKKIIENEKGTTWHIMRPPLVPLDQTQEDELISALKKIHA